VAITFTAMGLLFCRSTAPNKIGGPLLWRWWPLPTDRTELSVLHKIVRLTHWAFTNTCLLPTRLCAQLSAGGTWHSQGRESGCMQGRAGKGGLTDWKRQGLESRRLRQLESAGQRPKEGSTQSSRNVGGSSQSLTEWRQHTCVGQDHKVKTRATLGKKDWSSCGTPTSQSRQSRLNTQDIQQRLQLILC
jgi:hypothetical protein